MSGKRLFEMRDRPGHVIRSTDLARKIQELTQKPEASTEVPER